MELFDDFDTQVQSDELDDCAYGSRSIEEDKNEALIDEKGGTVMGTWVNFVNPAESAETTRNDYGGHWAEPMEDFYVPFQVKFLALDELEDRVDNGESFESIPEMDYNYIGGIAYGDVLICGCCGATFSINEWFERARDLGVDRDKVIFVYHEWADFSQFIQDKE